MSHIFRAFFAPMQKPRGAARDLAGVGHASRLHLYQHAARLLREEKPDYIAAIFESREKTFRHETFADYKANRVAMPDDLAKQMPYIFRLCEAFNIPVINFPGYEADDVIGTLAQQVAEKKMQAVIVSNDKDMCQLVRDPYVICMRQNSQVVKRKEPVPPVEWCDEAWVENKFGVTADKLVDLLGLDGRLDRQHSRRTGHRFERRRADHSAVRIDRSRPGGLGSQSSTRLIASRCAITRI